MRTPSPADRCRSWPRSCSPGAPGRPATPPPRSPPFPTPVEDLSLGVEFTVRRVAGSNRWVVIRVNAADAENAP